ncbi:hypothetical protein CC80DRAFT_486871 [Byssothecium circinans]|uniref:Uncharacterized protein n=1 Tax=Byssothecium circinans TaxID=147558 RepID=A0A6A5UHQ9_9PLEO|nr:hypothetical protein CC80DRAFT_486871 [Byssothecium circinans]
MRFLATAALFASSAQAVQWGLYCSNTSCADRSNPIVTGNSYDNVPNYCYALGASYKYCYFSVEENAAPIFWSATVLNRADCLGGGEHGFSHLQANEYSAGYDPAAGPFTAALIGFQA